LWKKQGQIRIILPNQIFLGLGDHKFWARIESRNILIVISRKDSRGPSL